MPDDPDVIRRTRIAMKYFNDAITQSKGSKVGVFMRALTEEVLDESAMVPPEYLEFYMKQAAAILYWTATGEAIINMPMPHDFKTTIPKELAPDEPKAIENLPVTDLSQSDNLYLWIHSRIYQWPH